jgi:hypothetical protein
LSLPCENNDVAREDRRPEVQTQSKPQDATAGVAFNFLQISKFFAPHTLGIRKTLPPLDISVRNGKAADITQKKRLRSGA